MRWKSVPRVLPIQNNAMVSAAARFARKAKILHFYTWSGKPPEGSLLDHLIQHMFSRREIDWRAIDTAARFGVIWLKGSDGSSVWAVTPRPPELSVLT